MTLRMDLYGPYLFGCSIPFLRNVDAEWRLKTNSISVVSEILPLSCQGLQHRLYTKPLPGGLSQYVIYTAGEVQQRTEQGQYRDIYIVVCFHCSCQKLRGSGEIPSFPEAPEAPQRRLLTQNKISTPKSWDGIDAWYNLKPQFIGCDLLSCCLSKLLGSLIKYHLQSCAKDLKPHMHFLLFKIHCLIYSQKCRFAFLEKQFSASSWLCGLLNRKKVHLNGERWWGIVFPPCSSVCNFKAISQL